ncbi:4-hydroxybenzoate 3-monooxygenase [Nostoc commune]|uniref:4-hydroxybenzoate 3-monooxygenase n=1 Tax=Nostoc commune TaxID=1178 RepID=UPI0018C56F62|nr:4-hydroxybenzoate 3-monooxygenase [Nostoc commune]
MKTSVFILGSGPAGIVLGNILLQSGIDCIVADKYNRKEIYARGRAGTLESTTIQLLQKHNLADAILKNGYTHDCSEFRYPEHSIFFDYGKLTGDVHYIYPQSDLNDDFIQQYLDAGGKLLFDHEGKKISQTSDRITVELYDKINDKTITVEADFVAGCDGYHGISRRSIPEEVVSVYNNQYKYNWLTILAYAPPSEKHIIYALHPEGFAAQLLRNDKITRYYIQIPLTDQVEDWPDERVWDTLERRLDKKGWTLIQGKIFDKRIMSLRSYVMEPLQYGRLFIAGDAAHIITPMGGKGLNLAVQDAGVLAETLINYYRQGQSLSYLNRYSEIRLPFIWRAQEFSYTMLNMVHAPEGGNPQEMRFRHKLSQSKLAQLTTSATFAEDFARNYVGIK